MALLNEFYAKETIPADSFSLRFAEMTGAMRRLQTQWQVVERLGQDEHELREVGKRCPPFQIRTVQFYDRTKDLTAKENAIQDFVDFHEFLVTPAKIVHVTQQDLYYGAFRILQASMVSEPQAVINVQGTDADGNPILIFFGARLEVVWTLIDTTETTN